MNDMIHSSNCILHFIKRLGSPVVIALRSRPEDWWFKPWVFQIYFSFLFINFFSFKWIQLFPVKKRAQKLFVQFHYFNVFMYVSIIYVKKQESKVLGYLSRLSFNFWTGWRMILGFKNGFHRVASTALRLHWSWETVHIGTQIVLWPPEPTTNSKTTNPE